MDSAKTFDVNNQNLIYGFFYFDGYFDIFDIRSKKILKGPFQLFDYYIEDQSTKWHCFALSF